MSLWVVVSVLAAFMQNLRFMLQKHLRGAELSTGGATFARFMFSSPWVVLGMVFYLRETGLPAFSVSFVGYAMIGGLAQILATACVVALFAQRNFAVGIVFKKTEVVLTALVGLVVLGEGLSGFGVIAIAIGFAGVVLLSDPPEGGSLFNKAAAFGLGSGALFGISAICYRGAVLQIAGDDIFARAGITLAVVTAYQTAIMGVWLRFREPGEIMRVAKSWRVSSVMGVASMLGSFGWFIAFGLQNAAYVKAVGQVELIFTFLASYFVFKERSNRREIIGILLIMISVLAVVLAL